MEIRKLQKTGGASLSVTLPKKWAEGFKLKGHDQVSVHVRKSGSLMLRPLKLKEQIFRSHLDATGLKGRQLNRELIAHFIAGADEIQITAEAFKPEQRRNIRDTIQSLAGFEIVSGGLTNDQGGRQAKRVRPYSGRGVLASFRRGETL